jgi:PAS domain S-box-containing protein
MSDKLRTEAEQQLKLDAQNPERRDALLHELQVHQIELEMQNEALLLSRDELEKSRDRYLDLYDFSPVGYLTLSMDSTILEINLTGAALLGVERTNLIGRGMERYIASASLDVWHKCFQEVLKTNGARKCELRLLRNDGANFYAELDCMCLEAERKTVRVAFNDISKRKQLEASLAEHQQLLRELSAKDMKLQELQSKHIAREVHDELGQLLTALRMDMSLVRIEFGQLDPALMKKIRGMLALVDKLIKGVRNVALNLRPVALDSGIVPAIEWLCDNFPGGCATACSLRVKDDPAGLDEESATVIFRIVQESLTNVARHAEASSVMITVGLCDNDIVVEVQDDGKGFDPGALEVKKSFGLLGMHERAHAVGGKVEINSALSKGTIVSMRIPFKPGEKAL